MAWGDSVDHITTPFGVISTAAEVLDGVDLSGQRVVVTGASSGLGAETARALADAGAQVTLAVRNTEAGERVAREITSSRGDARVEVRPLDLSDPKSIAAFVAEWTGPLDVLVNNAGVMALPELQLSGQGAEMHFAINHLGHFALAVGLHDALVAAHGARIVCVSSLVHMVSPFVFDDPHFARRPYHPVLAYGQSKTANVLFALEATRRWAKDGVVANALHPGVILDTNLSRHAPSPSPPSDGAPPTVAYAFKNIDQGAATSVLLAGSPTLTGVGGRYFQDSNEADVVERQPFDTDLPRSGVAHYALDPESAARLWELSAALSGMTP